MPNPNSTQDTRETVERFLSELKTILLSPRFDPARDLDIILRKKGEDFFDPYTTANTLLALGFDKDDVREELLKISVADYAETMTDSKNPSSPPFYVFYREIQSKEVYIKVKIRDGATGRVFCVSFHFARYPAPRPLPFGK